MMHVADLSLALATAEEHTRILHERALVLAQEMRPDERETTATVEVLVCRVANERYALHLKELRSVQRPMGLTRVPSAPHQVAGVLNVRGELIAVVDLAVALGLERAVPATDGLVILVQIEQGTTGVLVDDVLGVELVAMEQLGQPLKDARYTHGVVNGSTAFLDLDRLLDEQDFGQGDEDE